MRTGLITDIHGHLVGLRLCLDELERRGVDRIVCLGDLIDGGPENDAVVDLIRGSGYPCVRGNHDEIGDQTVSKSNRSWLQALPESIVEGSVCFVHISPRERPTKITDVYAAWNVFDETSSRLIFIGHVHAPYVFGEKCRSPNMASSYPCDEAGIIALPRDDRFIVSVGAVGYPRGGGLFIRCGIHDTDAESIELIRLKGPLLPYGLNRGQ